MKFLSKIRYGFIFTLILLLISSSAIAASSGKFKLYFKIPKEEPYDSIAKVFRDSGQFQDLVKGLNDLLVLPQNVKIVFQMGDGPYYDPNTKQIDMSYNFIAYVSNLYTEEYPKATHEQIIRFTLRSMTFIFYHEIAHALIDIYQLPIVSNEETAADNLAVIIALELTQNGYDVVMDSAELFDIMDHSNTEGYSEEALWDEHALDSQRFYNIICLVYGHSPKAVKKEIQEFGSDSMLNFIDEREDFCHYEYQRQYNAWEKLLQPHLR